MSAIWARIKKGNLVICCDRAMRRELKSLGEEIQRDKHMCDIFEPLVCNGLSWVDPADIGALTDAPILSDDVIDDDGNYPDDARFFWFGDYQIRSPLTDLLRYGKVVFTQ
jgi:hypothetical protein